MLEKTFGIRIPDAKYKERVGAYGIGFDRDGRIPVASTHLYNGQIGYFLLGGGIDNDEEHAECIARECLEEAGLSVAPKEFVCKGDFYQYMDQTRTHFHGIGYFYLIDIDKVVAEPTEPDHSLAWLTMEEAKLKLFLPHQVWAVEQAYRLFKM